MYKSLDDGCFYTENEAKIMAEESIDMSDYIEVMLDSFSNTEIFDALNEELQWKIIEEAQKRYFEEYFRLIEDKEEEEEGD